MTQSIEEAVIAQLRELPEAKQQEVLDFATFLRFKEKRRLKPVRPMEGPGRFHIGGRYCGSSSGNVENFPREQLFE